MRVYMHVDLIDINKVIEYFIAKKKSTFQSYIEAKIKYYNDKKEANSKIY